MRKTRSVVLFVMLLAVVLPSHGDMGTEGFSIQYLYQGWSPELRRQFYHTAQGTKLIPYDWFVSLTMNDGTLFKDTATRPRYGFLPNPYPANEHNLPIGFTGDPGGMLGLNCAACHTSQIHYLSKTVYIDGGASMQDNLAFMQEMSKALVATLENDKRRKDFALKVHMQEGQVMQEIKKALEKMQPVLKARKECQDPEKKQVYNNPDYSVYPMDGWGFGRLDALGRGGNTVLTELLNEPCGLEKADAPVSLPSLWDA
jgi:hypothetical protein